MPRHYIIVRAACHISIVAIFAGLAACVSSPRVAAPTPADALPRLMRATLLWTQGNLIEVKAAQSANANFVHTFPRPPKMRGLIPVAAEREWLEKWSQQVADLHRAGIFVSASVGSTCFNPEIFRQNGLDPERYFARDEKNQPSSMLNGAYGKELMTSCYSNPDWIALLQENVLAFARAGFDGLWYDVGGYADNAVLYCQCQHCRAGWRQHLVSVQRDPATPLPKRSDKTDYARWESREFLRWRWAAWAKWSAQVRAAVQHEYPKFAFAHNMGVGEGSDRGTTMFMHATTDVFDYVHWEEWGHGTAPYSDITSYQLGAAAGRGKPVMLVQNDKPTRNPQQHRIFLAEGYASGGVPQFGTRHFANSHAFLTFVEQHEDLYAGSRSVANVAVLYSAWSQAIYAFPAKRWPAHWMGQLLLDQHVPFDYVTAERGFNAEALAKYQTLVVPDQGCLSEAHVATIRAFLQRGGSVVLTGGSGQFDEELQPRRQPLAEVLAGRKVTGTAQLTVGRGKLLVFPDSPEQAHWQKNPRDFAKAEQLPVPTPLAANVADALAWAFGDSLPLQVRAPVTTVVLPREANGRTLLHLVNYDVLPDGKELHPAQSLDLALTLPAGARGAKVQLLSPDGTEPEMIATRVDGNRLRFTIPQLGAYAIVLVEAGK